MRYNTAEIELVKRQIRLALGQRGLTAWQVRFLTDLLSKFERHGSKTYLSEKQADKLDEILGRRKSSVVKLKPAARTPGSAGSHYWVEREMRWWLRRLLRAIVVCGVLAALMLVSNVNVGNPIGDAGNTIRELVSPEQSPAIQNARFTVTDGDTIKMSGETAGTRLVGFNAPETYHPQCAAEKALGDRATGRLRQLVANASVVQVEKVACSCKPGTEGTADCNFGRSCGTLLTDGKDVGDILIAEGLAVPFNCGRTKCPPLPKPWCN